MANLMTRLRGAMNLNDIQPDMGMPPENAEALSSLLPPDMLNTAAVATGREAPTLTRQRETSKRPANSENAEPSLQDIYRSAKEETLGKEREGRKPFKWQDLGPDEKSDTLLRLGLNLMQHSQSGLGLSGIGKAFGETLSHRDALQEANLEDQRNLEEMAGKEGLTLAQLAASQRGGDQADRRIDIAESQANRPQLVQGADGYYLADLAGGTATPLRTGEGGNVMPAATGRESAFAERVRMLKEIYTAQGMDEQEADQRAVNEALRNKTHIDPNTFIRARGQVMDTFLPNGRPSRELRQIMEETGMSAMEIIDQKVDSLLGGYEQRYTPGGSLSEMSGQPQTGKNPFLLQQQQ